MPAERQDICLGIAPREREEVKLTFRKCRSKDAEAEGAEDGRSLMMKKILLKARAGS
jgi:hypothetical protein